LKNTPLHEASLAQKIDCVKFLLEAGANPSIRNERGIVAKDFVKNMKNFESLFAQFAKNSHETGSTSLDLNQSQYSSTSTDDLNISCTYGKMKRGRKTIKKVTLFCTSMSPDDKIRVANMATKMNILVAKEMNATG
jgi:ankyrin repeat protein